MKNLVLTEPSLHHEWETFIDSYQGYQPPVRPFLEALIKRERLTYEKIPSLGPCSDHDFARAAKTHGYYVVTITDISKAFDAVDWCNDNVTFEDFCWYGSYFFFTHQSHATMFKLTWE